MVSIDSALPPSFPSGDDEMGKRPISNDYIPILANALHQLNYLEQDPSGFTQSQSPYYLEGHMKVITILLGKLTLGANDQSAVTNLEGTFNNYMNEYVNKSAQPTDTPAVMAGDMIGDVTTLLGDDSFIKPSPEQFQEAMAQISQEALKQLHEPNFLTDPNVNSVFIGMIQSLETLSAFGKDGPQGTHIVTKEPLKGVVDTMNSMILAIDGDQTKQAHHDWHQLVHHLIPNMEKTYA